MIGKLITYGKDRREAMDKMSRALGEYMITGNQDHHLLPAGDSAGPQLPRGVYSTSFHRATAQRRPPGID
jgi:acetyl-CoA carboxylase, biotin carboxylase subunit